MAGASQNDRMERLRAVRETGSPAAAALVEALAECAHDSWRGWMDWQFSLAEPCSVDVGGVGITLPLQMTVANYERWNRQRATGYHELPEHERQSDRLEAMRYWPAFAAFVVAWLTAQDDWVYSESDLSVLIDKFRAEMGVG